MNTGEYYKKNKNYCLEDLKDWEKKSYHKIDIKKFEGEDWAKKFYQKWEPCLDRVKKRVNPFSIWAKTRNPELLALQIPFILR